MRRTGSGQPHTFTVTLMKDTGDGTASLPAAGEHVDVTLTDSERRGCHTAPTGTLHGRGREHGRERSVHDHVHLEHDRQGDRARVLDAVGGRLGGVHGADRRPGAELGRRGEDVREREDLDRSGRDERGRGSRTRSR